MILDADEFVVGNDPFRRDASSAFLFARMYTNNKLQEARKKLDQKTSPKQTKTLTPTTAAKKV